MPVVHDSSAAVVHLLAALDSVHHVKLVQQVEQVLCGVCPVREVAGVYGVDQVRPGRLEVDAVGFFQEGKSSVIGDN